MAFIKFTKTGLVAYEWNSDVRDYRPMLNSKNNLAHLREPCEIDDGVTLGDIFQGVAADRELVDFISAYSSCNAIDKFHEQAKQPPTPTDCPPLREIVVEAAAELWSERDDTIAPESYLIPDTFTGVSIEFSAYDVNGVRCCLSYTPMNDLCALPVRLSNRCNLTKDFNHVQLTKYKPTLLEFLDGLYWDIGFHGGPEEAAEVFNGLMQSVAKIRSTMDEPLQVG